jgi:hypothetical protein
VVKRATQFLTEEMKEPEPPTELAGYEALQHKARLQAWMKKRRDGKK